MTQKQLDEIISRLMQEDQRWSAVLELKVSVTDPKWVPALVTHLDNKDWVVRWTVAEKLGDLKSPEALPHLILLLSDIDSHVRKNAFNALLKFKREAVLAILPYFEHPHPLVRQGIFSLLLEFGDDCIPILENMLSTQDWIVANKMVQAIWAIGGKRAEYCLVRCLSYPPVQKNTIMLLSLLKSEAAVGPLLELYLVPKLKKIILQAFAKIGEARVFPVLVQCLWTDKPNIQELAEKIILKIGKPILPYLVKSLTLKKCPHDKIFTLLETIGPEQAVPLLDALAQKKPELKKEIETWEKKQDPNKKGFLSLFS